MQVAAPTAEATKPKLKIKIGGNKASNPPATVDQQLKAPQVASSKIDSSLCYRKISYSLYFIMLPELC